MLDPSDTDDGIEFSDTGSELNDLEIEQRWHGLENTLLITSPTGAAMPGYSSKILHSDFQHQNGELEIKLFTGTFNRERVHAPCNVGNTRTKAHSLNEWDLDNNKISLAHNVKFRISDDRHYIHNDVIQT